MVTKPSSGEFEARARMLYREKSATVAGSPRLVRWLKFNLVGAIGIAVQFAALFLLKRLLHFDYLVATAIAAEAAVMHNFVWHEHFTWLDRTRPDRTGSGRINPDIPTVHAREANDSKLLGRASLRRLLRFHLGNGAVSLLGNLALMKVMVGYGQMNYLVANAIAIVMCSLANFLVSDEWVFAN